MIKLDPTKMCYMSHLRAVVGTSMALIDIKGALKMDRMTNGEREGVYDD